MERLVLTGAELAFMLAPIEPARAEAIRVRLGLTDEQRTDAVIRAGLSSLAVRGLLQGTGNELRPTPEVAVVLHGLTQASLWAEVSTMTRETVDVAQLYVHDRGMFLLSPRLYATYEIQGVRSGVSPVELLVSVARRSLHVPPALVACRDETGRTVAVAAKEDGTFLFSNDAVGFQQSASTVEDALRLFGSAVAELSPAMSTA
jgi:hypothetical protein